MRTSVFFKFQNSNIPNNHEFTLISFYINSFQINAMKSICIFISKKLRRILEDDDSFSEDNLIFQIDGIDIFNFSKDSVKLFNGEALYVNKFNIDFFIKIANFFEIEELSEFLSDLIFDEEIINQYFINNDEIQDLAIFEQFLLDAPNNYNEIDCIPYITKFGEDFFINSFFNICVKSPFIDFLQISKLLKLIEQQSPGIIEKIIKSLKVIIKSDSSVSMLLLLHCLFENGYLSIQSLEEFFTTKEYSFIFIDIFGDKLFHLDHIFITEAEKEKIKDGFFDIHKKGCIEGHHQDPILCAIRIDDITTFQNLLLMNPHIHALEKIKPCEYEKNSDINSGEWTLIQYCAFFGAVHCFKYLILNEQKLDLSNLILPAIIGDNKDIIKNVIQSNPSFDKAIIQAIKYHRYNTLRWIFDNAFDKCEGNDILRTAIQNNSFHSFLTSVNEGLSLLNLFYTAIEMNNTRLLKVGINLIYHLHKENYFNIKKISII